MYENMMPVDNWSKLQVGDKLVWMIDDFDGSSETHCTVTEVHDDHAIAYEDNSSDSMSLWIDEYTQEDFYHCANDDAGESIDAATYVPYNANNRGTNAPDCVKRAISMAFNLDYNEVSKLLLAEAKARSRSRWNIPSVYQPVMYRLGASKGQAPTSPIRVLDFIDQYVPEGACIIETNPKPVGPGRGNHLTCSVSGTLYDSWDSSNQYVCQYYLIEQSNHEFTDVDDHLTELIEAGGQLIEQLWPKYQQKYDLPGEFRLVRKGEKSQFSIYFKLAYIDKSSFKEEILEHWEIVCPFTPTMTTESAMKKMIETIKVRMYDRFYAINQKINKKSTGDALFYESGYTDDDRSRLWLDGREEKFFNSLPGWIQPFITYLRIERPGEYSDSYEVEALPIKGDSDRSKVSFYGFNSADVKDEINRYKKNFERVGVDYSYYEEY